MVAEVEEVIFPVGRLDLVGALDTAKRLQLLPAARGYVIDMQYLSYMEPFGMLFFSAQLRAFKAQRESSTWKMINHARHGYAAYMGLFSSSGFGMETPPAKPAGIDRYIQITSQRIRDLHVEAGQSAIGIHDVIEKKAHEMALVLSQKEGGDAQITLQFSLREILRNVIEHSNADFVWYAAQYWPAKQMVELSILDEGIGIRQALSRNPHLKLTSDLEALQCALMPGISGVAYRGRAPNRSDDWANSGYGLFIMSQMCEMSGSFALSSGGVTLIREPGRERVIHVDFSGTAIRLKLDLSSLGKLGDVLALLNKKGEELANHSEIAVRHSSRSSRISGGNAAH